MKTDPTMPPPECAEGPEAFKRFDATMAALLSLPHSTLVRRERTYRKKSLQNPKRRRPKRKAKASASRDPA